jgi:hypothetical protein
MLRKLLIVVAAFSPVAFTANAQSGYHSGPFDQMYSFAWDVNFPVNNNFVSQTSYDGFKFEGRKMIENNLSIGLELSWNGYDQLRPRKTYELQNGAVTTDLYSYLYNIPMAVNIHHYLHAGKLVTPYFGVALGATYSEQRLYYSTYVSYAYNWGFLVMPELGAIIKFHEHSKEGLLIGASYSYSTNSDDAFKINGLQSFGLQLGFVFMK